MKIDFKKLVISTVVMAVIYLGVSYLFTKFFGQEFQWTPRILMAVGFGFLITLLQIFLTKSKKRRR